MTEMRLIEDSVNNRLMSHSPTLAKAVEARMGYIRFVLILYIEFNSLWGLERDVRRQ